MKEKETLTSQNNQVGKTHKSEKEREHVTTNTPRGRKGAPYI